MCTAIDHWGNGFTGEHELVLETLSFVEDTFCPSCRWMGAEAILRKILMIMFLSPSTALPQLSPQEAALCCPYATAAQKRGETFLLCWRQGCTHTSCPCTALLPVKPTKPSPLQLPPFIWQKGLLPLSSLRDLHCSLPMPSSNPLPTPGLSHSLFLMPWVLITHIRALLCNVRLSKTCFIHVHKESSHEPQIQQQRNAQQTRKGV